MRKDSLSALPLWDQFCKAARERRRNPEHLLADYMRERLEIWEDQRLDEEIRHDARHSGYREEDAVDIVREHRQEQRERRAVS
jgi:uncharacterized protein YdaU (DUF1376 family)